MDTNERNFLGVWIPKEIWLSEEISLVEKAILTEITYLDNDNHCYATNEYFSKFCGVSIATVSRAIKHLTELGYIEVVFFNGRNRILKIGKPVKMMMPIKTIDQANQNDRADSSKRYANNIYNNIINNNSIDKSIENENDIKKTNNAANAAAAEAASLEDENNISNSSNNNNFISEKDQYYESNKGSKDIRKLMRYTNMVCLDNKLLADTLIKWLKLMYANNKFLTLEVYKEKLEKLNKNTNSIEECIEIINKAVDKNYLDFSYFYKSNSKNNTYKRPDNINTPTVKKELKVVPF